MKRVKKLVSVMLAMVMILAMSMTAMAAKVSVPEGLEGHTFVAYQIFSGTQTEDETAGALGDVQWGTGVSAEALLADLQENANFKECTDAASVAAVLGTSTDNSDLAKTFAKIAFNHIAGDGIELVAGEKEIDTGYYLIVDTTENIGEGDARNAALLQVTGKEDIEIKVKTDKPSVEKKVKENEKYSSDEGYGTGYNDVADYNIGDDVPFAFYSKVPDMTYYDTYKYVFHDKMSSGLTLKEDTIKVTVDGKKITDFVVATEGLSEGETFTVTINDLKSLNVTTGAEIRVDYTATLNTSAEIGLPGNTNEVKLEYSNNPNDSSQTGKTPSDEVIVFTYELDTTKVDGTNQEALEGAEFKLYKTVDGIDKYVTVDAENGKVTGWKDTINEGSVLTSDTNGLFKVIGLDAGTYYLKETKAPAGYNLLEESIEVVVTATTVNGQKWTDGVPANALTNISVTADTEEGTGNVTTGIAGITVENNKGATLPETGGIGTTIFYIIGIVIMAGAVFFLAMNRKKKED